MKKSCAFSDPVMVKNWIYPTNFQFRSYQLKIVETALFSNTLVCLPTGMGKTLIASVVMYNFYRWFPKGKVVFLAPVKPLVAQQISACHEVVGIPIADVAHLEGSINSNRREDLWNQKRVFFCTPQVLANDLKSKKCNGQQIVCLVFDEAHRATGHYAYTEVVNRIIFFFATLREMFGFILLLDENFGRAGSFKISSTWIKCNSRLHRESHSKCTHTKYIYIYS